MTPRLFPALLALWLGAVIALPAAAWQLVMVEQVGCSYCARWHAEVGDAYPLTDVGRFAPLRPVDLHRPLPGDLTLARRAVFTPTFVLVDDTGTEAARIEGYPGEDFFWTLLERMLTDVAGFAPAATQ